jgi:hypothetical protein
MSAEVSFKTPSLDAAPSPVRTAAGILIEKSAYPTSHSVISLATHHPHKFIASPMFPSDNTSASTSHSASELANDDTIVFLRPTTSVEGVHDGTVLTRGGDTITHADGSALTGPQAHYLGSHLKRISRWAKENTKSAKSADEWLEYVKVRVPVGKPVFKVVNRADHSILSGQDDLRERSMQDASKVLLEHADNPYKAK